MRPLPISLVIFTSTAQHFGFNDVYKTTIRHLERSLGTLDIFSHKIAHIKVRPRKEEEELLPEMLDFFKSKKIEVIVTKKEWSRGMSHQNEYLIDIRKIVNLQSVQDNSFLFWFEDDSPIEANGDTLTNLLAKGCDRFVDKNVLCYRFARITGEKLIPLNDILKSDVFHFQPSLCRSRDILIASNIIETNWGFFQTQQCEMAFTIAMRTLLGNKDYKFLVERPEVAFSHHIGTPDFPEMVKKLNLL